MKKKDINELKKAFDIPQPERKSEFMAQYRDRVKKNRLLFPVIMRYASVAVIFLLVIGIFAFIRRSGTHEELFTETDMLISETTTDNDLPEEPHDNAQTISTSAAASDSKAVRTTTSSVSVTSAAMSVSSVTAAGGSMNTQTALYEGAAEEPVHTTAADPEQITASPELSQNPVSGTGITTTKSEECPTKPGHTVLTGKDMTVTPTVTYTVTSNVISEHEFETNDSDGMAGGVAVDTRVEDMAENSDFIVIGLIYDIVYTEVNGNSYTQADIIMLDDAFKGSGVNHFDKISVYIPGGYMPAEIYCEMNGLDVSGYEGSTVYVSGGNSGQIGLDESYIFMLKKAGTGFPSGAYVLTERTDICLFIYNGTDYVSLGDDSLHCMYT